MSLKKEQNIITITLSDKDVCNRIIDAWYRPDQDVSFNDNVQKQPSIGLGKTKQKDGSIKLVYPDMNESKKFNAYLWRLFNIASSKTNS